MYIADACADAVILSGAASLALASSFLGGKSKTDSHDCVKERVPPVYLKAVPIGHEWLAKPEIINSELVG